MNEELKDCTVPGNLECTEEPVRINGGGKMYTVTITELDEGFIVKVGCKSFAFNGRQEMLKEVVRYVNEPNKVEKWYMNSRKVRD